MKNFEFYIEEQQYTINKLVLKNKSDVAKLFKVMQQDEIIRLIVVKEKTEKEMQIDGDATAFSVTEVTD